MWGSLSLINLMKIINNDVTPSILTQRNEEFGWKPFLPTPVFLSIIITTILISIIIFYYYFSIKKLKPNETPKGFALLLFILINYSKQLVFEILGPKFIRLTPYFITLFGYILVSNLIGIAGFENPTASVSVTLSMGLITFIGTFIIGFKYQRLSYLKKFLLGINLKDKKTKQKKYIPLFINPLEIIGNVTPLISISFRLWGNIFAGGIILTLFYSIPMAIQASGSTSNPNMFDPTMNNANEFVLIMGLFAAPLNAYLDVMTGIVQALVFVLLTMVYWKMAIPESYDEDNELSSYRFVDFENECCVKMTNISVV